ncbi:MerR family transcriptional regulator [Agromyces sp. S2-1-8]|uniref:MerR family transcriptional regulator n=1 Tax=Agromyces sp. S2-1-8 TaxID=2897180 RepID=UPI001E4158D5|nr:MerR family transcriptional regulator [Agromyces sp. S2-1-8]MCD5345693.1 MerR family transcriptional regulator [Agromyces sp. S2-1-8]
MFTTGQIARLTSVSQKAIRLYADRGLLVSRRDDADRRIFAEDQVERARRVVLLRSLDVSLAEVATVLDADDSAAAFDTMRDRHRRHAVGSDEALDYVRTLLRGEVALPAGLEVRRRTIPERAVLGVRGEASLADTGAVLRDLTGRVFAALTAADAPLGGPVYVEFRSRATETYPADLRVCAPFEGAIRPPEGMEITLDPAHDEVFVSLDQVHADDQALLVGVHDFLTAHCGPQREGPNREVYLPSFATGATGEVMSIAVPVSLAEPPAGGAGERTAGRAA